MLALLSKDRTLTKAWGLRGSMKTKQVLHPFRSPRVSGPHPPLPLRSLTERNLPGMVCGPSSSPQPHPTGLPVEQPRLSLWARWGSSQNSQQAACPWGTSLPASMSPLFRREAHRPASHSLCTWQGCPVLRASLGEDSGERRWSGAATRPLQWSGARILCLLTFSHPS